MKMCADAHCCAERRPLLTRPRVSRLQYFKFLDEKGGFFYERWGDGTSPLSDVSRCRCSIGSSRPQRLSIRSPQRSSCLKARFITSTTCASLPFVMYLSQEADRPCVPLQILSTQPIPHLPPYASFFRRLYSSYLTLMRPQRTASSSTTTASASATPNIHSTQTGAFLTLFSWVDRRD
jgi:hypothetical protein